jgi:hypothetical protein
MSEFKFQTYALMCVRLAAECRGLAADAPEPDLRAHCSIRPHVDGTRRSTACPALMHDGTWYYRNSVRGPYEVMKSGSWPMISRRAP